MSESDRALRVLLLIALIGVFILFSPFLTTLALAAVTTVLAWPVQQRLSRLFGERRAIATIFTLLTLTVGVLGPVATLVFVMSRELQEILQGVLVEIQGGTVERMVGQILNHPSFQQLQSWTGDGALLGTLRDGAQSMALNLVSVATQRLPTLLSGTAHFALDLLIYYLTVASLLYEGPAFLAWALRISPLKPDHTRRLFEVFAEFARNVVLAGLFTGMLQGVVAGVGYWILGVERPFLFALLTGTLAYVPLIGTALVWLPLSLLAAVQGAWGQAAGILAWSIFLTTSVDNFLKPLLVRGRSNVPPALIFLGVFGGLSWLGLIGILVGPVAVALLLALFRLYEESLQD